MGSNTEELFPELVEAPPQPQLELEDDNFEDEIVEEDEPLVPEITTRDKIKQDDIFVNEIKKETKNVKVKIVDKPVEIKEPIEEPIDKPMETPQVKPVKPVKKKRVMSESQKQKLAEARKKALEVRKAKAQQRKAEKDLIQQEKELTKKVRQKKVEKMKDEIANEVDKTTTTTKPVSTTPMFTKEDLDAAVLNGIAGYDKIRKAQKKVKKEAQAEEERKKQIFNTISKAIDPELDMWSHCFSR